jgi:uncharacterized membrane protein (UPF0136 family)
MNAASANLINSIVLIAIGLWGYFETNSQTAFIPVGFGVALLLCTPGVRKENKAIAHVAVLLTLVVLLAMGGMRLPKAIAAGGLTLVRGILPVLTGLFAMVMFIRSFIAARKARENAA